MDPGQMASEAAPSETASQKFSRYRSVRRQTQTQTQTNSPSHGQPPLPALAPAMTSHPAPAMPPMPPPEQSSAAQVPMARSMSRYHRRPTTSHGPSAKLLPLRSATVQVPPLPPTTATLSVTPRYRALSSPQAPPADYAQHPMPNSSRARADPTPCTPTPPHQTPLPRAARDEAKQLLQDETERHRRMRENQETERQERIRAEQAERERQEQLHREEQEEEERRRQRRRQLQHQQEEARKQAEKETQEAASSYHEEKDRGKRLQKTREKEKEKEPEDKPTSSPPSSPSHRHHHHHHAATRAFNLFHRKKDEAAATAAAPLTSPNTSPPRNTSHHHHHHHARSPPKHEERDVTYIKAGGGGAVLGIDAPVSHAMAAQQAPQTNTTTTTAANNNNNNDSAGDREMDYIKAGGGGAVLGIDAPISAVNAGDRRVTVICNNKKFLLPVTPDTTAQDLLKSAALCMTESINPRTDIFIENFQKVGVQRPVRLYEHVRDILNSWDNDMQNDLEIVNAAYHGHDRSHLVSNDVPDKRPDGITCYLYHSSRPGKWNKRFITLRPDGQLGLTKSETAKDLENICHLSDFDIYMPTKRKQSKIKPPKKHCYAVKSQQKSNIFSDESRYVHFFSTSDPATAARFLDAVQAWRSWHLKHVMGEGHRKPKAPETKPTNGILANAKALSALEQNGTSSHNRNTSVGSFYQLGSFQPLFDMDQFSKDVGTSGNSAPDGSLQRSNTKAMHARKMSVRTKKPPPAAFERNGALINDVPSLPIDPTKSLAENLPPPEEDTFASTGLLGRTYTHRQKAMQEREQKASGPFTEGPSLVSNIDAMAAVAASNDNGVKRRGSVSSTTHRRTSSDIQRSISTRAKPRPLVDLTPQYREPPQHRNKGKGFDPGANSGPLVESATSVDEAIHVPSSTDWRGGRPGTARAHGTYGTGGFERTRSMKGRGEGLAAYTVNNHAGAPADDRMAFTGGLLAARAAGFSQGRQPVGRGVMDGSKAKGPMLDMSEASQFASGSLLADVQRRQGPTGGPVADRENK